MTELYKILDEQRFPYQDMELEERNFCLEILNSCKDICDSDNKVGNTGVCEIVEMSFRKTPLRITGNGSLSIGDENIQEYRSINVDILIRTNKIFVEMEITRLGIDCENKVYTVEDEFKMEKGILIRKSKYNYKKKGAKEEIINDNLGGKIK